MVDEVNQEDDSLEYQSGGADSAETEKPQGDTSELEAVLAKRDEELTRANARIVELEETVSDRDSHITMLEQSNNELEGKLTIANDSVTEAVASYRNMILRANPDIVEELISGDTIESLNGSLEKARSLIGRVRQGLESEIAMSRVPPGAAERRPPDLSALSPREKIQYAIGGKR